MFMKVKQLTLAFLTVLLLGVASCEKEDNEAEEISTAAKIQAKWKLKSWVFEWRRDGKDSSWTLDYDTLDEDYFWDLRQDNVIYEMRGSTITDTLDYVLQNDATMLIRFGATVESAYTIRTLTDNTLQLYNKEPSASNPDNYYADTWNLSK